MKYDPYYIGDSKPWDAKDADQIEHHLHAIWDLLKSPVLVCDKLSMRAKSFLEPNFIIEFDGSYGFWSYDGVKEAGFVREEQEADTPTIVTT